jgi:hypothetical protein
MLSDVE